MNSGITIRLMKETDKEFILSLATRFNEFELMKWRDRNQMKVAQLKIADEMINNPDPKSEIFIAEDENSLLGYLQVTQTKDFFTGENQGYVSSITVSKEGEGKGIAKMLMNKAEEWSRSKGYKQLVLNVFANNKRAINFYHFLNFQTEILKMVKELD